MFCRVIIGKGYWGEIGNELYIESLKIFIEFMFGKWFVWGRFRNSIC